MRAFFISYRRQDAEGQAGRLFDDLVQAFGEESVFMDVAGIEPGRDFRKSIDEHVASCGVLLAMIGKGWLDAQDEAGRRRLDDPQDFVRIELASALKRSIPVVPVLVQGARMPKVEQLPAELADLAFRNAIELTHARWDSDLSLLLRALRRHLPPDESMASEPAVSTGSARPRSLRLVAPVAAALTGAIALYIGYWRVPTPTPEHPTDSRSGALSQDTVRLQLVERASEKKTESTSGDTASQPVSAESAESAESSAAASRVTQKSKKKAQSTSREPEADIGPDAIPGQMKAQTAASRLAPRLEGSWTWGQPCSQGPSVRLVKGVRQVKDKLVFAHTGPDFVHAIVSDNGSKLRTRVVSPASHAGDEYEFQLNGTQLVLFEPQTGERNVWDRCER